MLNNNGKFTSVLKTKFDSTSDTEHHTQYFIYLSRDRRCWTKRWVGGGSLGTVLQIFKLKLNQIKVWR